MKKITAAALLALAAAYPVISVAGESSTKKYIKPIVSFGFEDVDFSRNLSKAAAKRARAVEQQENFKAAFEMATSTFILWGRFNNEDDFTYDAQTKKFTHFGSHELGSTNPSKRKKAWKEMSSTLKRSYGTQSFVEDGEPFSLLPSGKKVTATAFTDSAVTEYAEDWFDRHLPSYVKNRSSPTATMTSSSCYWTKQGWVSVRNLSVTFNSKTGASDFTELFGTSSLTVDFYRESNPSADDWRVADEKLRTLDVRMVVTWYTKTHPIGGLAQPSDR